MNTDVIIIGGGLGGLSAGAYLSQNGIDVTLIESQPHVGGYAIAFKRDEFIFDVALHAIPGCSPGQPFHELLSELNVAKELTFKKLKSAFNIYLGDYNFVIPNSLTEFFSMLHEKFPNDKKGLDQLKSYLNKYASLYYNVVERQSNTLEIVTRFIPKIPDFLKNSQLSTDNFLNQYIKNKKLKALLYQAAVFFGEPMSEFPAINFIIMFYLLFKSGMYTIEGGGQALTNTLENKMLENNARILCGRKVNSIKITKKLATSVILDDGSQISSKVVISNVNTLELVKTLIKPELLPASYTESLNQLKPSLAILQMHLGLNCPIQKIGVKHYLNIFFPDENIDKSIKKQNNARIIEGYSIIAPGINYPDCTSSINRTLSIVGGVSGQSWIGLSTNKYRNLKKEVTDKILELIENRFPNIRSNIKTIDLATPHTFNRYTQNPFGAILGFRAERGNHRILLKTGRFPIKNLYLANAWTNRLGGFMQTVKSGIIAAQKSLKYLK